MDFRDGTECLVLETNIHKWIGQSAKMQNSGGQRDDFSKKLSSCSLMFVKTIWNNIFVNWQERCIKNDVLNNQECPYKQLHFLELLDASSLGEPKICFLGSVQR